MAVVLLGRVLFAVGVRHALRRSGADHPLADFAVMAATTGVILESLSCGVVGGNAIAADSGADAHVVAALDSVALGVENVIYGPIGLSFAALAWVMLRSHLFNRVLCSIGLVAGVALTLSGLVAAAPSYAGLQGALGIGVPVAWVWMLWTGVLLWRRSDRSPAD